MDKPESEIKLGVPPSPIEAPRQKSKKIHRFSSMDYLVDDKPNPEGENQEYFAISNAKKVNRKK